MRHTRLRILTPGVRLLRDGRGGLYLLIPQYVYGLLGDDLSSTDAVLSRGRVLVRLWCHSLATCGSSQI